jgi:hypothetical protein
LQNAKRGARAALFAKPAGRVVGSRVSRLSFIIPAKSTFLRAQADGSPPRLSG